MHLQVKMMLYKSLALSRNTKTALIELSLIMTIGDCSIRVYPSFSTIIIMLHAGINPSLMLSRTYLLLKIIPA